MSWRGKYVGWFRLLENEFDKLVPELSDMDVLESVTLEDTLIIPTIGEDMPRNQRKAHPSIVLILKDDSIETRISYSDKESMEIFRNILNESQKTHLDQLIDEMGRLDPSYETLLYSKARDEKKPRLVRKYVTSRLDEGLLERILNESEQLRRGGRRQGLDSSIYIPPETPEFILVRKITPLTTEEFVKVLHKLKPIYALLLKIKTQREMISARLKRPRHKRNLYREFIELLNGAKEKGFITAMERRKLNDKWRKDEDSREELVEELNRLIEE